jgi:hypothetical protein
MLVFFCFCAHTLYGKKIFIPKCLVVQGFIDAYGGGDTEAELA